MSDEFCVVLVTAGKREEAEKIAEALAQERLAACCNLLAGARSIYRWKGEVCRDEETLIVIKTRTALFAAVRDRVLALHSYELPEIIRLPIAEGHAPYLDWLRSETRG